MSKLFEQFPQVIEGEVLSKTVEGASASVEPSGPATPGLKQTMTQAEMDAFLARSGGAKQSPGMQSQLNQMMSSMSAKDTPEEEKKDTITVNFSTKSDFTPPPALFAGIGNTNSRYKAWIADHFKAMLSDMGQDPSTKGYSKVRHVKASQFMRTCVYIHNLYKEYKEVKFKLVGPRFPRDFDYIGSVEELIRLNKDILNAIAPMFNMGDKLKDPAKAAEATDAAPSETATNAPEAIVDDPVTHDVEEAK